MIVSFLSYFNPCSNQHHGFRNSIYLPTWRKIGAIALSALAGTFSFGILAIPVFRLLCKSTEFTQKFAQRCDRLWLKKRGHGLLHDAVLSEDLDLVKSRIDHGAFVNLQTKNGLTPLRIALKLKRFDIAKILIENGASVNLQDNEGYNPLHHAALSGQMDAAEFLLDNGASIDLQTKIGKVLSFAVFAGNLDMAKLLLKRGASLFDEKIGSTILHGITASGRGDLIKFFFDQGVSLDLQDNEGVAPLHLASSQGNFEIAKLLIDLGASVNQQTNEGDTPLHMAADNGHTDLVNLLINRGGNVDLVNKSGFSVLAKSKIVCSPNYKRIKQRINLQSKASIYSKKESCARHLLGHLYSLKGESQLLSKKDHNIIPLNLEGSSGSSFFWKKIFDYYQLILTEYPDVLPQESSQIFLDTLGQAQKETSSADLYQRWKEGKPLLIGINHKKHARMFLIDKNKFFFINTAQGDFPLLVSRQIHDLSEAAIQTLIDDFINFLQQHIWNLPETQADQDIQEKFNAEIPRQKSGNCTFASKAAGAFILFRLLGGNLNYSDISTYKKCIETNKYLDKIEDPESPYLPSPLLLAQLAADLQDDKAAPHIQEKADLLIKRLNQVVNDFLQYPTDEMSENVKAEWLKEVAESNVVIDAN